ncbi:NAD(P)-binding domain-containing protein [Streptomyces sp. N2-109]|uniref:NAD(P)-binding domain-containing protein n=1 Tax=Streptomyces gossypii TaxID=2883101 RepID=A0ABT2K128_9ACTN|nr:NAD(P)-binding domain-containing protein [Streptomyces gossypii]MCT2593169.1 NAD(P)-binding domain-containing protein [Streptomyces gossypii]
MSAPAVAVLGTGRLGGAIATTLLAAGHPTAVWNRSPDRTAPLVKAGATVAATPAEAAATASLVILCVTDDKAAQEILARLGTATSGRTLVNVTTSVPEQARSAAAWAAEHGTDYLAAAAMTDYRMIGGPETHLLYAGPRAAYERHEPTLLVLGGGARYVGTDHGVAALFDMSMNSLYFEFWIGYLHTLALMRREGVSAADFAPVVARTIGEIPPLMPMIAQQADKADYDPTAYGTVAEFEPMAQSVIDMRRSRGIDTERLQHLQTLLQRRIADGYGEQGPTSLIETIEASLTRTAEAVPGGVG